MKNTLDLALIGNGTVSALITHDGDITWACFPRFDGDPAFCSLLTGNTAPAAHGHFSVELIGCERVEQEYLENAPVLVTRMHDATGGSIEIIDFSPRFQQYARIFCPMSLVRRVTAVTGHPRIRIRVRPMCRYGQFPAERTYGSNHIRFIGGDVVLRLTTDASLTPILEETPFFLDGTVTLLLGVDETVTESAGLVGRRFLEETLAYWRNWVRALAIPFEWQDVVIQSAIVLKLNAHEDTGAIIAAMTTSIPEATGSERNWDYRYCWIRDAYFVVDALNRLGATRTMERFLTYILNVIASAEDGNLQPMYTISGRSDIEERTVASLAGYRGMGPVRVGNDAYRQVQHDVYGAAILAATHLFFDRRLEHRGDVALFERLERIGHRAAACYDQPDAGIWELRGSMHVHTFSSVMCWAGCDRLARIAAQLGLLERHAHWRATADRMHIEICHRCWNADMRSFVATMDGNTLDASLLRMHDVGFVAADDIRFVATVHAIERDLRRGDFIYRYVGEDDFGKPENAFLACTFWYINALAAIGRDTEARELFENVLACRNPHGLLAEHIDPETHEQWGNFVQTYSMVGLISSALRLSIPWERAF
ncbi:MAG: glycoside hydrolase family 15 protein [Gemmatimonadaceae bacterium]|nr:glycoside hydrolase family 15 protein [Gemmatimonadaceae bacterium]